MKPIPPPIINLEKRKKEKHEGESQPPPPSPPTTPLLPHEPKSTTEIIPKRPPPPPNPNGRIIRPPRPPSPKEPEKIDLDKYRTPFDIYQKIDWKGVKCARVSDSGSGSDGVVFFQTSCDRIFVMKSTMNVADEIFPSKISELFGIRSPLSEIIEFCPARGKRNVFSERSNGKEKKMSMNRLTASELRGNDWWDAKICMSRLGKNNLRVKNKLERDFVRGFYILFEFIPGWDVYDAKRFKKEIIFTSKKHLNDLGRMYVFDLLINSNDRFPVPGLFDHEGNENNFLFLDEGVVAIDQTCQTFNLQEQKANYLNEIEKIVTIHKERGYLENVYIDSICEFFSKAVGRVLEDGISRETVISEDGKKEIWGGMDDIFKIVTEGKVINCEVLEEVRRFVRGMKTGEDWENVYRKSMEGIDVEFMGSVLEVVTKCYNTK